jgi:hypothetical protein
MGVYCTHTNHTEFEEFSLAGCLHSSQLGFARCQDKVVLDGICTSCDFWRDLTETWGGGSWNLGPERNPDPDLSLAPPAVRQSAICLGMTKEGQFYNKPGFILDTVSCMFAVDIA